MDQVLNLDRGDDILDVHSKIEWSDGRRVILVVPRGCKALDSEHELRLLRRWADNADVQVSLVTADLTVRELATEVGLPLFSSVEQARRARWTWHPNGSGGLVRDTALDPAEPRPRPPLLDRLGLAGIHLFVTVLIFGAAAAVMGTAAVLLIPSARLVVVPAAVQVTAAREAIVESSVTSVDVANSILPGTPVRREISGTATLATSKLATAPADRANGAVVFANLAGTAATIPVGTIVESSSGVTVRFSTTVQANLPADYNAHVTVPVQALDPGPAGNVKALQINFIEGPLSAIARVVNPAPTGGGSIKQVHVVAAEDKDRLREQLLAQLQQTAVALLQNDSSGQSFVPAASVQVLTINEAFDHLVDDPTDTLSLHVEAVATGVAVDRSDLQTFGAALLSDQVPPGYSILSNSTRVEAGPDSRAEGTAIILPVRAWLYSLPPTQSVDLLKGLEAQSPQAAAAEIGRRVKLAQPPLIQINPSWWPRLPFFGFRMTLFVEPELQFR